MKKEILAIISVILLTVFAIVPLFKPGFFPIHDNEQIGRLYDLDQAIKSGQFPPRIGPNLGFGYGYPFFNFYPPFAYYVAEVFVVLGFSYIASTKIMIVIGFVGGALAMYLFCREFFGKVGSMVAAVAYTYLPYHAVDVYVRGALPEFFAFVFVPLIFWSLHRLWKTQKNMYVILTSFFIAMLILTHNLVALMSFPFIAVFFLFLLAKTTKRKPFFLRSLEASVLALSLSSYFWLPSYFEKQFTMIDLLTSELARYSQHFLYIRQFWNSPWGYGGSIYGLLDGLSFQAGKAHIVVAFLTFFYALYSWRKKHEKATYVFLFFGLFIFALFMCTFYSQFIWDNISALWYIQFPWRFLLFAGFAASFLSGTLLQFSIFKNTKKTNFLGFILIFIIILTNKDYFVPERYLTQVTDKDYTNTETIRYETSKLAAEYVPKGIATRKTDINTTVVDIDRQSIAKTSYDVIDGEISLVVISDLPQKKQFTVDVKKDGILQINTFSFPGWKVFVDNRELSYSDDNKLKLIRVTLPKGQYSLTAIFSDTPVRKIGNALSFGSISLTILYTLFAIRSKKEIK